jgi:biopolymer transport protein ExbD
MVTTTFVKDMTLELERPSASSSTMASSKAIRLFIDKAAIFAVCLLRIVILFKIG